MDFLYSIFILLIAFAIGYHLKNLNPQLSKKGKSSAKPLESMVVCEGVQVDILKQGKGPSAEAGKSVRVHYNAWLESGLKVDSSFDKGEAFTFKLGHRQVIPGWEAGMLGMKVGEKRKFTIAPDQAYGDKGKANVPPNATIIFEVELLKII